jgi:hypothetical protein
MTGAAVSVFSFGCYLVLNGLTLLFAPNVLLSLFGIPATDEPWIRVLGVVVFILGLYYAAAGRQGVVPFFHWTIWGRGLVLLLFVILVVTDRAPRQLIAFGLLDAAGAVWTAIALRSRGVAPA